jgi:hypothetical protein
MSDALSIFQQPHPPAFSPTDAADLARLREAERLRTEARIDTLETSLASAIERLDAADERADDLADRLDAVEAAAPPAPAKGAAAKPTSKPLGKDGAPARR